MVYQVKEIFFTLQGEGAQTGRAAVFLRFAGCNLWTGLERDRTHAVCQFCDTDFVGTDGVGGGKFATAAELASAVGRAWPGAAGGKPLVVCTGGEPALQLDDALIAALRAAGFEIAIESNGTLELPRGLKVTNSSSSTRKRAWILRASKASRSGTSSCSPWMGPSVRRTRRLRRAIVLSIRAGGLACKPTS